MGQYIYQAIDRSGQTVSGTLESRSLREAARALDAQGLTVYGLRERVAVSSMRLRSARASHRELHLVLLEFVTLLESGVALAVALASLARSSHHHQLTSAFAAMDRDVRRGEAFSAAFRASGLQVPEYFHQLTHAGEATGRLADAMRGAIEQFDYDRRVSGEIRAALVYPAVLVASGVGAVAIIFLWVVPRFGTLLTQHGEQMPALSRHVIESGVWLKGNIAIVSIAVATTLIAAIGILRRPATRARLADAAARLPLLGDWLVEAEVGRWSNTLAALLNGRVELIRALGLAAAGVKLNYLRQRMGRVGASVKAGVSLSAALREHRALNPTGYDLVAVGETSGELPKLLNALGRLYETTGRDRMKRVLQLIEPLAIIVIGGVIGLIVTAIMLAITSVNDVPL